MSSQATCWKRKYLYAIVASGTDHAYGAFGIDGSPVHYISNGRVAAVVSDISYEKIRPERRHLAAHQGVLKRLMESTTPLPMSFGIIADSPQAIRRILSLNQEAFYDQLHRVEGKVEMGLRVNWDVPNIFEFFVNRHPELRAARDRRLGSHRTPSQQDKIEIGQLFERMRSEDREAYAENVEEILYRHSLEIKRNRCRNECEVMNLTCLVPRDGGAKFEAAVFEAAKLFDNNFAFDFNGPWAPHSFIDLDLKL